MLTIIAVIISIILQFVAMIFAISLIRFTKYNSSWILLSIGLMIMAVRRLFDFLPYVNHELSQQTITLNSWLGVLVSLLLVVGVLKIRKIFEDLKRMEEIRQAAEKRVLNAVIMTEENERKRLSKNLHDGLVPLLSSVKMSVSSLAGEAIDGKRRVIYENAMQAINESINSLKEISNNLSPHVLNNYGLNRAIRNFTEKTEKTGKIHIEFRSNLNDHRFDSNTEIILYRTVCELITNTIKHADAQNILINLDLEDKRLRMLYQDDGKGFEFQDIVEGRTSGMGINNIRSRIASINGTFEVDSWPDEGIVVTIDIKTENNE
ncbi:MAG: sensor histidine kinase [Bacteroidota bacterium]